MPDSSLTGQNVTLRVAGSALSVTAGHAGARQGTRCTLAAPTPASRGGTTTTEAPGGQGPAKKG